MSHKKLASTALLWICCFPVAAHEDDDWHNRWDAIPAGERFKFRVGTFLVDRTDTTARFDSNRFPLGTLIDLEDDLNVDRTERVARLDGFYRFTPKHRIEWSYYTSRRGGEAVAEREFQIGDPDNPLGGFVIPKGARVDTQWDFDLLKVGYDYSFLNKKRYEMFIGAGLNFRNLNVDISYQANVGSATVGDSINTTELLPLPTATIGGRWNLTRKLQAIFSYDFFFLEFDEYVGQYQEVLLSLEHSTFKHVGFGAAIDLGSLNVRANNDDFRGEFDYRVAGLFGYVKFYL